MIENRHLCYFTVLARNLHMTDLKEMGSEAQIAALHSGEIALGR